MTFSETVLISPMNDDVSRNENMLIKEALFQFIILTHESRSNFCSNHTDHYCFMSVCLLKLFNMKFQLT